MKCYYRAGMEIPGLGRTEMSVYQERFLPFNGKVKIGLTVGIMSFAFQSERRLSRIKQMMCL